MDTFVAVEEIERAFGIKLPPAYRQFLIEHPDDLFEPVEIDALVSWPRGPTATIDSLSSSQSILASDTIGQSCDAERAMLIIGDSAFGGYLYLCWESQRFGQIFFREPYQDSQYYLVARSFQDFMSRRRPVVYDDGP